MPELEELPVTVDGLDWAEKHVRTGGINGPIHSEWKLQLRFVASAPVRCAIYLQQWFDSGLVRSFDKATLRLARREFRLNLALFPTAWERSTGFSINHLGVPIEDSRLHHDVRETLELGVSSGKRFSTARPVPLLNHVESQTCLGIIAVASADTLVDRMRWRLKDDRPQIAGHDYLRHGRATGRQA